MNKECPRCKLVSNDSVSICDCGYRFETLTASQNFQINNYSFENRDREEKVKQQQNKNARTRFIWIKKVLWKIYFQILCFFGGSKKIEDKIRQFEIRINDLKAQDETMKKHQGEALQKQHSLIRVELDMLEDEYADIIRFLKPQKLEEDYITDHKIKEKQSKKLDFEAKLKIEKNEINQQTKTISLETAMIHCRGCGKKLHRTARSCPECGAMLRTNSKSKKTAGWLALLLGAIGIHRFYLGNWWGIFYLFFCWTLIPGIIALIEAIVFFTTDDDTWMEKYG